MLKSQDHHGQSIGIGTQVTIVDVQFRVLLSQILGTRFAKEIEVVSCSIHGFQANPAEVTTRSTIQTSDDEAEAHQGIVSNAKDLEELLVEVQFAERTCQLRLGSHVVSDPHVDQTRQAIKRQQNVPRITKRIIEPQNFRENVVVLLRPAVTGLHRVHDRHPQGAVRNVESEAEVLNQDLIKERQVGTGHHIHILRKRAGAEGILRIVEDDHRKSTATHHPLDLETPRYLEVTEVRAPHRPFAKKELDQFVTNIDQVHRKLLKLQREDSKHQAQTVLRSTCLQEAILDNPTIIIQTSRCRLPSH